MPKGRSSGGGSSRSSGGSRSSGSSRSAATSSGPTTKSGAPDMRFSANRSAAGLPTGSGSRSGATSTSGPTTKSGAPDMRFSANRSAAGLPTGSGSRSGATSTSGPTTKSGAPDMRFSANRSAAGLPTAPGSHRGSLSPAAPVTPLSSNSRLTKSGLSDKRYKEKYSHGIPSYVKTKADGTPDMRTKEAREWVDKECAAGVSKNEIPAWIPRTKTGELKDSALTRAYFRALDRFSDIEYIPSESTAYYERLQQDKEYLDWYNRFETQDIPLGTPYSVSLPEEISHDKNLPEDDVPEWYSKVSPQVEAYEYSKIVFRNGSELGNEIGRGTFGIVYEGDIDGITYAIKHLSMKHLAPKEHRAFITELNVLAKLGDHTNIIKLEGYTITPPCIIMELAAKNSLYYQLYENDVTEDVAALNHNKYRMKIAFGVANALAQLVHCRIVHGDIKPQNVLLTEDFTPKLCDFGLAKVKSRVMASSSSLATDNESQNCIGGTYAYLAPELLNFENEANEKTDVYSYGILINELMVGNYPYAEQFQKLACRPPDAVAQYAKLGNRPKKNPNSPKPINDLIDRCWHQDPLLRPTFEDIMKELTRCNNVINIDSKIL